MTLSQDTSQSPWPRKKWSFPFCFPKNYYLILYPIYIPNRNLTPPPSFWFLCVIRYLMVLRYIDNNPAKGKIPSTWHIPLLHAEKTKIWLKRAFAAHDTATHHAASTASIYNFFIPQLQLHSISYQQVLVITRTSTIHHADPSQWRDS